MPSSPVVDPFDHALEQMLQTVRRITASQRTRREQVLAEMVTSHHSRFGQKERRHVPDMEVPPIELVHALSAPAGIQQLVVLDIAGRRVKAVIEPLGMRRPDRELAVWKCLIELTEKYAA